MLRDAIVRQPLPGENTLGLSLTSVAARSSECSPGSDPGFPGIGMAAEGDSLRVMTASTWISSEVALELFGCGSMDVKLVLDETLFIERTTSPLQIGQVRRRVVSHGVLRSC